MYFHRNRVVDPSISVAYLLFERHHCGLKDQVVVKLFNPFIANFDHVNLSSDQSYKVPSPGSWTDG